MVQEKCFLCRYQAEKQILNNQDQLTVEWAGTYRHYHSAMFRTIPIGKADPKHHKMHEACVDALKNCENKLNQEIKLEKFLMLTQKLLMILVLIKQE